MMGLVMGWITTIYHRLTVSSCRSVLCLSDSHLGPGRVRSKGNAMEYRNLTVCRLTKEHHDRTCGYWYTVQSSWTALTAFESRDSLDLWLGQFGLVLDGELNNPGDWCKINGVYRVEYCLESADQFLKRPGARVRRMSNGDYTVGIIRRDTDGARTVMVHHGPDKIILDRKACAAALRRTAETDSIFAESI